MVREDTPNRHNILTNSIVTPGLLKGVQLGHLREITIDLYAEAIKGILEENSSLIPKANQHCYLSDRIAFKVIKKSF